MTNKCPSSEKREVAVQFGGIKAAVGAFGGTLWWNQFSLLTCCVCDAEGGSMHWFYE